MRKSGIDLSSECSPAERACITEALRRYGSDGNFLEVGTAAGGTLKEIILCCRDRGIAARFHVLDPFTYFPNQLEKVKRNLGEAGIDCDSVVFWKGTTDSRFSQAVAESLRFSFIFIDADHRAYPLMTDLMWMERLAVGGIACFHDYSDRFPGVVWSLDRFLSRNPGFETVLHVETLVVVRRTSPDINAVSPPDLLLARIAQALFRARRGLKRRLGMSRAA